LKCRPNIVVGICLDGLYISDTELRVIGLETINRNNFRALLCAFSES
jgi:hypothetical protein